MPLTIPGWERREARLVISAREAAAMLVQASRFGVANGGRFDVRSERVVVLRSTSAWQAPGGSSPPVAAFALSWAEPNGASATIRQIAWNAAAISEDEVWRAIDLLRDAAAELSAPAGPERAAARSTAPPAHPAAAVGRWVGARASVGGWVSVASGSADRR